MTDTVASRTALCPRRGSALSAGVVIAVASTLTAVPASAQSATPSDQNTVVVTGQRLQGQGTTEEGYRVEDVQNIGPWGGRPLLDTPYSITVYSKDQLQNRSISEPGDLARYDPRLSTFVPSNRTVSVSNVISRGFTILQNNLLTDGLVNSNGPVFLEDKERVEVMTGLSGFLYGPVSVGGEVNFVLKRPTASPFMQVNFGTRGDLDGFVHVDVGGPIAGGKFGIRFNGLVQGGTNAIDRQSVGKTMASGAIDWNVLPGTVVQLDAAHYWGRIDGITGFFRPSAAYPIPAAPQNDRAYGQPWSYQRSISDRVGVRVTSQMSDALTLRGAYRHYWEQFRSLVTQNFPVANTTAFTVSVYNQFPETNQYDSYQAFADLHFTTGPIEHRLTGGIQGDHNSSYIDQTSIDLAQRGTFAAPFVAQPLTGFGPPLHQVTHNTRRSLLVGDDLRWGIVSVLAGVNWARVATRTNALPSGTQTASYDRTKATPSVSLIVKPLDRLSIYGTYIQSLEQGGMAPATARNAGTVFAPLTSTQYEVGAKVEALGALFTVSLFDIDKTNQYVDPADNTFKQEGREIHKGVEATITGRVLRDLTVVGGLTAFRARVRRAANAALNGTDVTGVPQTQAKAYLEYTPRGVPGVALTGGVDYTSRFLSTALAGIAPNYVAYHYPGYTIFNLGGRVTRELGGKKVTFRLLVDNLTDKNYFASTVYLGEPRTFRGSVSVDF